MTRICGWFKPFVKSAFSLAASLAHLKSFLFVYSVNALPVDAQTVTLQQPGYSLVAKSMQAALKLAESELTRNKADLAKNLRDPQVRQLFEQMTGGR